MYLQIKKAKLTPDKYGNNIQVSMVWLYEDNGKRVKRVKLDQLTMNALILAKVKVDLLPDWEIWLIPN